MPKKVDVKKRHQDLARAAALAIAKNGLTDVTLAMVAKEAGWSTGALTHYVDSKDQLLLMAAEYAGTHVNERILAVEKKYKGIEALRHGMYQALPYRDGHPGMRNIWFGFWERASKNSEVRAMIQKNYKASYRRISRYLKDAQKAGEIRKGVNVNKIATSALAFVEGLGATVLVSGRRMSARQQCEYVDDWIMQLLAIEHPDVAGDTCLPRKSHMSSADSVLLDHPL